MRQVFFEMSRFQKSRQNYLERAIFGSELWADEGRETMTSELKEQTSHSKLCRFCILIHLVILVKFFPKLYFCKLYFLKCIVQNCILSNSIFQTVFIPTIFFQTFSKQYFANFIFPNYIFPKFFQKVFSILKWTLMWIYFSPAETIAQKSFTSHPNCFTI